METHTHTYIFSLSPPPLKMFADGRKTGKYKKWQYNVDMGYVGAFQGGRDDEDQWVIETSSPKG